MNLTKIYHGDQMTVKSSFNKTGFLSLFKTPNRISNKTIIPLIELDFQRLLQLRSYIESQECPNCKNKQLKLTIHEQGKEGWETQILCGACASTGVMNSTGVHFNLSSIPEKTEKAKK